MRADVCLVVEGAYPYVTGGVASWTHQLVCGMPDVNFALLVLVPDEAFTAQDRYPVPPNVVSRRHVTLFDAHKLQRDAEAPAAVMATVEQFHAAPSGSRCPIFGPLVRALAKGGQTAFGLETARSSWHLLTKLYQSRRREVSFLDYFWTWRATHGPVFRLLDVPLPEAAVYHPLSTGYAGALAAIAKERLGARVLLTEHGIYTRERVIEIAQAEWIFQEPIEGSAYAPQDDFFKTWWRAQYDFLGKLAYDAADRIVTLNDVNRRFQIEAGAPEHKFAHIPNGVPASAFTSEGPRSWAGRPFQVGLIGRVVPIKDIKTFLRAVQIASAEVPLHAYVIGPEDEDAGYHEECLELVALLGLQDTVTFTGRADVPAWLGRLDLNVLTSVSESQPLVLLEAWAAGVPAVTTDVGACREMVDGRAGDDALLGPAGLVTPVATPEATARAIVTLAKDPDRHAAMARAGRERVARYYRQEHIFDTYRALYRELAALPAGAR